MSDDVDAPAARRATGGVPLLGRGHGPTGIDLLADAGAERIKICYEPDNPASKHRYLDVGFEPDRRTVVFSLRPSGETSEPAWRLVIRAASPTRIVVRGRT